MAEVLDEVAPVHVRVGDVKKWVGRESTTMLESPWPEALRDRLERPLAADPTGVVRVQNTGEGLLVTVEGRATFAAECGRCLKSCALTVPFSAEETYREEQPGPDDEWLTYQGDMIALDDLVADAVCLAEPMAPVCRADCRGLCPRCGRNLNVVDGPCGCGDATDDRWAALAGWAPDDNPVDKPSRT